MTSYIIAIDPGSSTFGYVLVRRELARVRYVASGTAASTPEGFRDALTVVSKLLSDADYDTLVVALEVCEGMVFAPYRAPGLLSTSEMVGVITALAWEDGIPVLRFTAAAVRKLLVGKASSPKKGVMDRLIEDAVKANVMAWPKISSVHCRDAAALGVIANWHLVSRRVA